MIDREPATYMVCRIGANKCSRQVRMMTSLFYKYLKLANTISWQAGRGSNLIARTLLGLHTSGVPQCYKTSPNPKRGRSNALCCTYPYSCTLHTRSSSSSRAVPRPIKHNGSMTRQVVYCTTIWSAYPRKYEKKWPKVDPNGSSRAFHGGDLSLYTAAHQLGKFHIKIQQNMANSGMRNTV